MGAINSACSAHKNHPKDPENMATVRDLILPTPKDSSDFNKLSSMQTLWIGEWTYLIKNEVHSFDILAREDKLVYSERLDSCICVGRVFVKDEHRARIVCKKMKFEIEINREDMIARYRTLGTKKWSRDVGLMKVDDIEVEPEWTTDADDSIFAGTLNENCTDWDRDTLRNTWKNIKIDLPKPTTSNEKARSSMRGAAYRKMRSLELVNKNLKRSMSDNTAELLRRNSSRRTLRFSDDVKDAFSDTLLAERK